MKVSKTIEQGGFVLIMLALQQDHTPVKSRTLSDTLAVSDSYLKKVLRKLVVAGLIKSTASKDGGFQLSRKIEEISFYDIAIALDPFDLSAVAGSNLARNVLPNSKHLAESETKLKNLFEDAADAYYETLKSVSLASLLEDGKYQNGAIDWSQA